MIQQVLQCSYCFDLSLGLCRLAVLSRDTFRHTEFHMVKSIETLDIQTQRSRCKCLMCGVFVESSSVAHSFSGRGMFSFIRPSSLLYFKQIIFYYIQQL